MRGRSVEPWRKWDFLRQLSYIKVRYASLRKKRAYLVCPKYKKELCHIYGSTKTWSKSLAHKLMHFSTRWSSARCIQTYSKVGYSPSIIHHKLHPLREGALQSKGTVQLQTASVYRKLPRLVPPPLSVSLLPEPSLALRVVPLGIVLLLDASRIVAFF